MSRVRGAVCRDETPASPAIFQLARTVSSSRHVNLCLVLTCGVSRTDVVPSVTVTDRKSVV